MFEVTDRTVTLIQRCVGRRAVEPGRRHGGVEFYAAVEIGQREVVFFRFEVQAAAVEVDLNRTVMVEFVASVNENMPWDFQPKVTRMEVHPGETYRTAFYAKNRTGKSMVGQAIPSVTPGVAARHFKKTECFCFTEQLFEAGEGRDMPLLFMVDPDLPDEIEVLTLAYTFFDKQKHLN